MAAVTTALLLAAALPGMAAGMVGAPTAIPQDVTIQLDANGVATVSASQIDNGSTISVPDPDATKEYEWEDPQKDVPAAEFGVILIGKGVLATPWSLEEAAEMGYAATLTFTAEKLGPQTVTLLAWDDVDFWGDTASATVTVEGPASTNNPPVALCMPATLFLDENGQAILEPSMIDGGSEDPDGDPLTMTVSQALFTCADLGPNQVVLTVKDPAGAEDSCVALVTVKTQVTADIGSGNLWPPNHKTALVDVALQVGINNICGNAIGKYVAVYADEDDEEATGDGHHSPDAKYDEETGSLRVRAERKGNSDGRVYLITVRAHDASGNLVGWDCATVVVPKSRSKKDEQNVLAQAAAAEAWFMEHGQPPLDFVPVGEPGAPVLGPKQ